MLAWNLPGAPLHNEVAAAGVSVCDEWVQMEWSAAGRIAIWWQEFELALTQPLNSAYHTIATWSMAATTELAFTPELMAFQYYLLRATA